NETGRPPLRMIGRSVPRVRCASSVRMRETSGRVSGGEDFVQQRLCLLLFLLLSQGEFGDEDLPRLREHPLLSGREAPVLLTTPQIAHDLCDLDDIAGLELLEIRLVAAGPVR